MDPDLNDALNYTLTYGSDLTFMNSVVIENSNNSASNTEPFENENYTALGEFQGSHYFLSNSASLWSDANTMLDGMMGAHLVTITSEEENVFLTEFVTQDTWIGLNDVAEEGVFEWVTGEEVTYTNWREGEPNNSNGNEPYVHMFRQGDWNDGEPDNEYFYIVEVESGSELSYAVEDGLQDHTEYFWQVTARDMSGATHATSMQTFMVNSENENPEGFTLVSPDNGSVVSSFDQLLVWNLSTDLDGDFIEFDVQLNGESIGVTDHNYMHVNDLAEDQTYTWSVTATDNNDGFTQSEVWSFTVNTVNSAPQSFALLSPESEMMFNETSVTFEWEVSEDSDGFDEVMYLVEIHSDSTHMTYETSENVLTVDNLMDNHIYHWNVMAQDMNGAVTEGSNGPRMFIVNVENEAPTQVSHITPTEESIEIDLSPLFYWTEASDPDPMDMVTYHLILTQDIAGDMVHDTVLDSNSYSFDFDLEDNSDYFWKVNTLDSYGLETVAPDYVPFYTDAFPEAPLPFATVTPENDAAGIGTEVEFVWNATSDPDPGDLVQYQLVYALDWNDSSTYVFTEFMEDTTVTIILEDNRQYSWKVIAQDDDEFVIGSDEDTPRSFVVGTLSIDGSNIPETFALHQNYPNPFNPTTNIKYDLPQDALVKISIYDVMGRNIKTLISSNQSAGYQSVRWDATNNYGEPISAGMYIYTIQAGDFRQTKKMVLLK
jgi:hypothetical protein